MSNLLKQRDELLEAVKAPTHKKAPNNNSLYFAVIAADIIFGVLDIGSGLTVYWITGFWFYGVLVFLAGIAPLLLNQKLYTRAYASQDQKKIAIGGAVLSVFSILGIGLLAAVANVAGYQGSDAEMVVVITIVVLAFIHAMLLIWYFYSDEGIQADQTLEQTIARAIRQARMVEAGDHVLSVTKKSVDRRHEVADKHGSKAALLELLRQMGADVDNDGIPDIIDPIDNRTGKPFVKQYAQGSNQAQLRDNGDKQDFQTPPHQQ